ncbi:MAG: hypothetical protein KC621_29990 [Myxococcales bacterium]|nr:hypothetical protein [Myxococcales bacterium]
MLALAWLPSAAAAAPDLVGTWRVEWVATNQAKVPLLGTTTITTRQVSLARIGPGAEGLVQEHDACAIRAEARLATTTFPDGFLAALPHKVYAPTLTSEGETWRYRADTGPLFIGYDPLLSPDGVPTEIDHPSVTDWDADGRPGGTVRVKAPLFSEVDVYVVQRSRGLLDGLAEVRDGRVVGLRGSFVLDGFEQHTIGASNRLFHTTPRATFVPESSWFEMHRVADDATCASITEPDRSPSR